MGLLTPSSFSELMLCFCVPPLLSCCSVACAAIHLARRSMRSVSKKRPRWQSCEWPPPRSPN
eukprot:4053686-Pyramimonas_sp.AAC.1